MSIKELPRFCFGMAKVKEFDKYKNFENLFFKKTSRALPGVAFTK